MEILTNPDPKKSLNIFYCLICHYNTSSSKDYNKHLITAKHQRLMKANEVNNKILNNCQNYECDCGKGYKHMSSLCKHKKTCKLLVKSNDVQISKDITPELIIEIIKQNKELQQTLIEQNKTIIELANKAGSNTNYINSNNNKTFNLQVFLNETCKDAINLTDFVNQIQLSVTDLEETGKLGYAEGISKVFIKNLNDIDFTQRPIHCSDSKREILYIKHDNQWNKDDENKSHLTKAIKNVANKNIKQINEWQKINPEYKDPESKQNDKYMKIVLNAMSGSTPEEQKSNINKIIKNVTKEVVIEK
jgi:hypothetical protein